MLHRHLSKIALIAMSLAAVAAQATVYKWTDTDGDVHYAQTPPPGVAASVIGTQAQPDRSDTPAPTLRDRLDAFDQRRQARKQDQARQALQKKNKQIQAKNCELARTNLSALQSHGQVTIKQGTSYRKLTEKQRQAKIAETQNQIDKFCAKTLGRDS